MIRKCPYLFNIALLAAALVFSIALGAVFIPPGTITRILLNQLPNITIIPNWPASSTAIIQAVRLPHTILVAMTGAALATSGAAYQGLFRNPLADPYLIGVASGAGLGAVLAMSINWPSNLFGYYLIPAAAFVGAITTVVLVYNLARVNGMVPLMTLILAGVASPSDRLLIGGVTYGGVETGPGSPALFPDWDWILDHHRSCAQCVAVWRGGSPADGGKCGPL